MKEPIRSHRDLIVWQRAVQLAVRVYQVTDGYPRREVYGLTDQTRRSAVSVAANIAEGHGRRRAGAFANHLGIALGSTAELDTHFQIAMEIGYLSENNHQEPVAELTEITKMLHGLYRTVSQ